MQKVILFFIRRGEGYVLTLQLLDSPMREVFPPKLLLVFLIWPSSSGAKRGPKLDQKYKVVSTISVKI